MSNIYGFKSIKKFQTSNLGKFINRIITNNFITIYKKKIAFFTQKILQNN